MYMYMYMYIYVYVYIYFSTLKYIYVTCVYTLYILRECNVVQAIS